VQKAIADLQLANTVLLNVLGVNHPYTMRCAVLLAEARMFHSPQQSATSLERCLATVRTLLHPLHRDQVIVHHVAAVIHLVTRDNPSALVEAAAAHAAAVELNMPENHLVELESTLLGALCRCHEQPAPALIALLESRVKSLTFQYGETSDLVVTPLQNLAEAHYLVGDFQRAHHYLSRALKIADSVNFIFLLGNLLKPVAQLTVGDVQERNRIARDRIHTQLALRFSEILFQIAAVFDAEGGRTDEAQSTYLQSLAAQEISGVVGGLSVVQILSSLAALLYSDGHFGDALAYAEKAHSILLENFPTLRAVLDTVCELLRIVLYQLRCNGYTLLRHPDSRHRFTTYV
jgi:tetratricopeptide (TPR) repeat protein